MADLPDAARRVAAAADALGLSINVVEMANPTRSAEEAAAACGCDVAQIVKSLVFLGRASAAPHLLLVSGENRVDETGIAAQLGEGLNRPDAQAVRHLTGYAIGGIPPLGHARSISTFMDARLLDFATVWAAAGTPRCVFSVAPDRLRAVIDARIVRL